jgi:hypothetical protein
MAEGSRIENKERVRGPRGQEKNLLLVIRVNNNN